MTTFLMLVLHNKCALLVWLTIQHSYYSLLKRKTKKPKDSPTNQKQKSEDVKRSQDCGTKFKSVLPESNSKLLKLFKNHWLNETLGSFSVKKLVHFGFYFQCAWIYLMFNTCFQIPFGSQYWPVEAIASLSSGTFGMAAVEGGWIKAASTHWWGSAHCAEAEWHSSGMFLVFNYLLVIAFSFAGW